ncbi:Protein of unknown function [Cotesia congregata]|uniref:Uncharacterized protein n=1 Tax=Cotesia congregata TaxID=51543 RepID=A0A8J2MLK1_COTCN|nr:Protein of unknown function [Cotesia congregata]
MKILIKIERSYYLEKIKQNREECIEIVLKDLVYRRALKLPVPTEELKLMDQLIATDRKISDIVNKYNRKVTESYSLSSHNDNDFRYYCYSPIIRRIKYATDRLKLLENLKKISSLRKAIPLSYELRC